MPRPRLQFWFEFASTYSYVAAMRVERLASAAGVDVEWKPFLLGPLFAKIGWTDSPFNIYPIKGAYMWRDMERLCQEDGIALRKPSVFPRNSLLAARIACVAASEQWANDFVRAVFSANFATDEDISDWSVLESIIANLGQDADTVHQRALSPANKDVLKSNTGMAADLGIFGAPSFVVGTELFWGNDRLTHAIAWADIANPAHSPATK
jgi:2-hydroxychromene-2-carboxylate isomerase